LLASLQARSPDTDELALRLKPALTAGLHGLRDVPELDGYWLIAAHLASTWSAPSRLVQMLVHADSDAGALLRACDAVVIAKRHGLSQRRALLQTLPATWRSRATDASAEIDIALVCDYADGTTSRPRYVTAFISNVVG